jgi:hypothetical protein
MSASFYIKEALTERTSSKSKSKDAFCVKQSPGTYSSSSEFFLNESGILYRSQPNSKHQLVVQQALIHDVIKENHDPPYVAHPGIKKTYSLISLKFWWPGMRKSIQDYIRSCDPCQRRNEDREFVA